MKLLIQRVAHATVEIEGRVVSAIQEGLLVFVGIAQNDTPTPIAWLANKLINLRIFEDYEGKMNQSLIEKKGSMLIVSQFTLYADCSEGRRPSFTQAAPPQIAEPLYEQFVKEVRQKGIAVETGVFGAEMKISLLNDGPVTLILER